ncbi:hypothetical protein PR003_g20277 [Phytophthora rubi]|uniref:WRKY19-like zinc finger domain-containing protein n=1 Tax=Phytophthora rubi TaxID=129364 RepID=A0A6A3K122_9STRA|nr:hypothetical protein PR001_g19083 [Phytophthora rubi]KAE9310387.1 hypothetical protein PR003_g20277 [Phytophthora rubi]
MDVHQHHAREFRLESTTAHADVMDAMGGTTPPSSANKWRLLFILNAPALPSEPELKSPAQDEKKRRRMCKVAGCTKYIVQMGRCCRHGGGKKCLVDGCFTGAKHRGLCWNTNAKARGLCWSHGGGTRCQHSGCTKVTISKGFCWAHGGGKRCLVSDCIKPAFERTHNFCQMHYKKLPRVPRFRPEQLESSEIDADMYI